MNAAVQCSNTVDTMARGVLAQCARSLPLPSAAQDEIASCLEWFKNLPATRRALAELCDNPIRDDKLLTHTLQHDERIVLQWLCQQSGRHMHVNVQVLWQNNDGAILLAAYRCRLNTQGAEDALRWAKSTWKAARLGPCQRCQTPTQKRLCLVATRLCARCSLATAIAG